MSSYGVFMPKCVKVLNERIRESSEQHIINA